MKHRFHKTNRDSEPTMLAVQSYFKADRGLVSEFQNLSSDRMVLEMPPIILNAWISFAEFRRRKEHNTGNAMQLKTTKTELLRKWKGTESLFTSEKQVNFSPQEPIYQHLNRFSKVLMKFPIRPCSQFTTQSSADSLSDIFLLSNSWHNAHKRQRHGQEKMQLAAKAFRNKILPGYRLR